MTLCSQHDAAYTSHHTKIACLLSSEWTHTHSVAWFDMSKGDNTY
jgi:hypothetical protein